MANYETLHVVFDGPPGPQSGRFIEVETPDGRGVNAGEWHEREDGYWELRITRPAPKADGALVGELRDILAVQKSHCDWTHDKAVAGFMEANGATILAALSDRDLVLEGLLRECRDVLDGLNDDEINVEFLPRIDAALKGGVDE